MKQLINAKVEIFPHDGGHALEFDKVLNLASAYCMGASGVQQLIKLEPLSNVKEISILLHEVSECKLGLTDKDVLPIYNYNDINLAIERIQIENYVLDLEDIISIKDVLRIVKGIDQYFSQIRSNIYPHLYAHIRKQNIEYASLIAIQRIVTDEGEVRSDASEELVKIRKRIGSKQQVVEKQFRFALNTYKAKGILAENLESIRNGRRVLTVMSEFKKQVKGILHDESATGKMVYIEPEEVIEPNNELFDLEQEERREIYRVIKELCQFLSANHLELTRQFELLVLFDVIHAKAKLAVDMDAEIPQLKQKPQFNIKNARHPLLLLKNKSLSKTTVPFDLHFDRDNHILVISGPNAGGKSILMKSIGLIQLMMQSGFLVPMDKYSEMGVFDKLCADIGDLQSFEDDLSTYSGKVRNMAQFMQIANDRTLILIDEFGSGTDPRMGGAIAEAVLKNLHEKGVFAVMTTHYGNLKVFTYKTKGIFNGAMHFDKELLQPSYKFLAGRPGSSYAYEITRKMGFPQDVMDYALNQSGQKENAIEDILIDLQQELVRLQEQANEVNKKEEKLERLIRSYDELQKSLELNKKKFKLEQKETTLQKKFQESKEIDKLLKELREEKNVEKIASISAKFREEQKKTEIERQVLEKEVIQDLVKGAGSKPLQKGDFVRIKTGGAVGEITQIDKNKVQVKLGDLLVSVKITDVSLVNKDSVPEKKSVSYTDINRIAEVESKVDLRGMRKDEALKVLESFVDNALIHSVQHLRILHGRGDGILKKAVHAKLKEYKDVTKVYHPDEEFGGVGITLVQL